MICRRCSAPTSSGALFCRACGAVLAPLFTARQIGIASFLASPVAAGLLAGENLRRIGRRRRAIAALLLGAGGTVAQVGCLSLLPESFALTLAVQSAVTMFIERLAAQEFDALRDPPTSSSPAGSWGVVAAVAVAAVACFCLVIVPVVLMAAVFGGAK